MEPIRRHDKRNLESIPVGSLGLIPLKGCENIGKEIDYYLGKASTRTASRLPDIRDRRMSWTATCRVSEPVKARAL